VTTGTRATHKVSGIALNREKTTAETVVGRVLSALEDFFAELGGTSAGEIFRR
jgi:hypothetical protein